MLKVTFSSSLAFGERCRREVENNLLLFSQKSFQVGYAVVKYLSVEVSISFSRGTNSLSLGVEILGLLCGFSQTSC